MFDKIRDFIEKHKITIGVVGTAVVLGSAYGSCSYDWAEKDVTLSRPEVEDTQGEN